MVREDPYIVHLHCCQCRAPTSWSGPIISTGHQRALCARWLQDRPWVSWDEHRGLQLDMLHVEDM